MHETTLVNNVVEIVLEKAEDLELDRVNAVHLTIGRLRDISEDIFEGMFERLTKGTVAEGAKLVLTRPPVTLRCKSCGYVFHFDARNEATHKCPACSERNYAINTGMEFFLNGIEAAPSASTSPLPQSLCA